MQFKYGKASGFKSRAWHVYRVSILESVTYESSYSIPFKGILFLKKLPINFAFCPSVIGHIKDPLREFFRYMIPNLQLVFNIDYRCKNGDIIDLLVSYDSEWRLN